MAKVTKKHAAKFESLTKTVLHLYKEYKSPRSWKNLFGLMKRDLVVEPIDSVCCLGYKEFAQGLSESYYVFNTDTQKWCDIKGKQLSPASQHVINQIMISDYKEIKVDE